MTTGILIACIASIVLAGCGGSKSTTTTTRVVPPVVGGTAQPPAAESPPSFKEAANDPERITSVAAAIETAADLDPGMLIGLVTARAEHASGLPTVSVSNRSGWSIGSSDGNPMTKEGDFGPWAAVTLRKDLGESTLYADVYTDIEAPESQVIESGDGSVDEVTFSLARLDSNASISAGGGISGLRGTYDGDPGVFNCSSPGSARCRAGNGRPTEGTWSFTPDRPPGAKDVRGVSGVVFTGEFNRNRTAGTFNGQVGYFKCTSTSCGYSTSDGRLSELRGDWIFVPVTRETVTEPDKDYLTGGVWLVVPDDESNAEGYSFGVFATGSDPFEQGSLMSLRGSATYRGPTVGLYVVHSEDTSVGSFDGTVELTADFGNGSSLGTISGSASQFQLDGEPADASFTLETAAIGSQDAGAFEGVLSGSALGVAYAGKWGGRFFGNGMSGEPPGSIAGTVGGNAADGSASFAGTFGAYRP